LKAFISMALKIDIITIFPEMFEGPFNQGIIKRAMEKSAVEISVHNLRDYTTDKHKITDDYPFGGGGGMVMKPEPIFRAVEVIKDKGGQTMSVGSISSKVILLTPQGKVFNHEIAMRLSRENHLIFLCGRYEGVDERVREKLIDEEISIGDYVLTGGEFPAMVIVDAIVRLLPNVLGCEDSYKKDSFYEGLLDYPHYTRPEEFREMKVPDILLSGHHKKVEEWRRYKSLETTYLKRPDLMDKIELSEEDLKTLEEIREKYKKNV